jgi:hypothetical protein
MTPYPDDAQHSVPSVRASIHASPERRFLSSLSLRLTIRLSDAGMRDRKSELIYLDHRFPPWPIEAPAGVGAANRRKSTFQTTTH